eukprot:3853227-Amphidinium_carterae.1
MQALLCAPSSPSCVGQKPFGCARPKHQESGKRARAVRLPFSVQSCATERTASTTFARKTCKLVLVKEHT